MAIKRSLEDQKTKTRGQRYAEKRKRKGKAKEQKEGEIRTESTCSGEHLTRNTNLTTSDSEEKNIEKDKGREKEENER